MVFFRVVVLIGIWNCAGPRAIRNPLGGDKRRPSESNRSRIRRRGAEASEEGGGGQRPLALAGLRQSHCRGGNKTRGSVPASSQVWGARFVSVEDGVVREQSDCPRRQNGPIACPSSSSSSPLGSRRFRRRCRPGYKYQGSEGQLIDVT